MEFYGWIISCTPVHTTKPIQDFITVFYPTDIIVCIFIPPN